ncbi:LOW QUALITY PROTEIN: uncharacterized protein ACR2FA_006478 [Aphomia sociella]
MHVKLVKENVLARPPLSVWWLVAALAATAGAYYVVSIIDLTLPEPLMRDTASPQRFIAEIAHEHLVNLTSMGPRVAGSYENEVAAVRVLVQAVQHIARAASPHNRVDLDLQTASGAFSLSFFDGMNNVYRDVQNVVARVRGVGGRAGARTALLLNCHYDTVPDSPGASDDGAGCAVLLETMRALAAAPRPLRHDVVFLFNGAEENIMQGSHAFITQHEWAKSVRAFINIEACGAGGREVLFQAGPHDPWIVEVYASVVPHPFASSLAQEMFESGLIPADTDFRIFRDFGNLSGLDLAWSANGYVYHTALDTAERVPPAALQRTGDNVLALVHGLLEHPSLRRAAEAARPPVYFDVLGARVLAARPALAAALAAAALALVALNVHGNAGLAAKHLYLPRGAWWRAVAAAACRGGAAAAAGVLAAAAVAAALAAAGARLAYYAHDWLLVPLFVMPALGASWAVEGGRAGCAGRHALVRGWWAARARHDALCGAAGALVLACAAAGLRVGFVPLLWTLPAAADALARRAAPAAAPARAACVAAAAAAPLLQTCYLRVLLFHVRRHVHAHEDTHTHTHVEDYYWLPEIDANTPHSLDPYGTVEGARAARPTDAAECARWPYCGAPYYLPVLALVPRGHALPAPRPRAPRAPGHPAPAPLAARVELEAATLRVRLRGGGAAGGGAARWARVSVSAHAMSAPRSAARARLAAALPAWTALTGWPVDLHLYEL